jgi:hypothetical protein
MIGIVAHGRAEKSEDSVKNVGPLKGHSSKRRIVGRNGSEGIITSQMEVKRGRVRNVAL